MSLELRILNSSEDTEWDHFVASAAGGHHLQTTMWAHVKAVQGWHAERLEVVRNNQIIAGVQVLIRPTPFALTKIAHVGKGPLYPPGDRTVAQMIITELVQLIKINRIRYLVLQPALADGILDQLLTEHGFRESPLTLTSAATVLIDLRQDLDVILARMKSKTRYNIRLSQRKGVVVREGTDDDLDTFYQLLTLTGQRQGFTVSSRDYFNTLWNALGTRGAAKLFIAEVNGQPVSALLAIPFGDTVIYKRGAWSGAYSNYHANELLHWTVIQWAKAEGYRYYDFEGIDRAHAEAAIQGKPLPEENRSVGSFKLGFGGDVVVYPCVYDFVNHRVLDWAYRRVLTGIISPSRSGSSRHFLDNLASRFIQFAAQH